MSPILLLCRLSRRATTYPRFFVGGVSLAVLVLGSALPGLDFRTEGTEIYPIANPVVRQSELDRQIFEQSPSVILLVASKPHGPPVASPDGFRFLKRIPGELRRSIGRPIRVWSLADILEVLRVSEGSTHVRPFLSLIPEGADAFETRLEYLAGNPLSEGLFLSSSGKLAAVYLFSVDQGPDPELIAAARTWMEKERGGKFDLFLAGPLVAESSLGESVLRDLLVFAPFMAGVIVLLLWFSLRSAAGVAIPLLEFLVVVVWTFGTMSLLGLPVTLISTILPVVLMAMAISDEIHLLERVQSVLRERGCGQLDREVLRDAVDSALTDLAHPIVITSLTTALGFLSFLTSSMRPLQEFGLMAAVGILLAMVLTFTWVPALIVLLPPRCFKATNGPPAWDFAEILRKLFSVCVVPKRLAPPLVLGLVLFALPGIAMLSIQDSWIDNFDPDSDLVRAERAYNREFWGSYRVDVVVHSTDSLFSEADGLRWIERFVRIAEKGPGVGGVASGLIPLGAVARYLGLTDSIETLSDPEIKTVIATAQGLGSMADLRQFFAPDGTAARIQLFVNSADFVRSVQLQAYLERQLRSTAPPRGARHHFSGDIPLAVEVVRCIVVDQLRSISFALLSVGLVLTMVFRSLKTAAVLLFPASASVALVLAAMGYGGVSLGVATSMFAPMTVGAGVDFALHFAHAYRRGRQAGRDHRDSVATAFGSSGRAIVWNALVLSAGLLTLTLSDLKPNHSLGLLLAGGIVACCVTTLALVPAHLVSSTGGADPEPNQARDHGDGAGSVF